MDTRPRGRGRQNPQPRLPGNTRFEGARPGPPRQPGGYAPRTPWRQPAQVPPPGFNQIRVPRPQTRPQGGNQHLDSTQAVEQISRGISNLSSGSGVTPVPLGRGAVRGSRVLDTAEPEPEPYYRVPRPESSKNGKEGTSGQPLNLVANYFPLKSYTELTLYQYRVDFSPEEDRIGVKRGLLGVHRKELGGFLFDGTMMFSTTKYNSNVLTLSSKREADEQIVTITVTFTNVLESHDYTYIQVFNLILRKGLRHLNLSLVGRNYYDPAAKISIPRHKLQLWPGYETTIGMFDSGLLLRAEISTKVMRDESVLDSFRDCLQNNRNHFMEVFKARVIGTVVLTRYNNQTYRVDDVDESASPRSTFKKKDGSQISYLDYYKKKWNITLRDANQPMLLSKKKKSLVKNDDDELVYLVPELCSMTGITEHMRENFPLMKELNGYTRVDPMERVNRYNNFIMRLQSNEQCAGSFNEWNIQFDPNLVNIKGRVLAPQRIYCNTKMYEAGEKADWTHHVRGLPMFTSALLERWAIVYPNQNEQEVRSFVNSLQQVANKMHFNIPTPERVPINAYNMNEYLKALEQVINQSNPSMILCVISSSRGDLYKLIKGRLSVARAVPSQVVLLKNVSKNNLSICTKIAIQINCKLGGAPWKIAIPSEGVMIIGFDVNHDKQHKNKSYGALVATLNDSHTKYYSCVRPHPSGQELSANFNYSIAGALTAYKKHNQKLPKMIIIYRDGVGDGQVSYVHKTEVAMVKNTCQTFYGSTAVPMAFIIVKKRINTRFFSVPQAGSRPSNPPPGTVVDSVITDPSMYDFFLVSQHVTFGTVTPTHYNVIVDTLPDWSPNKMQLLTYKLTHMYYNWSGTVRVPAPCQLAHKLAFFTAKALQDTPNVALNELLYFL